MRDGLRALIEKQPGMEVVAEAENAQGAIELAHELQPDIIIMDIHMPDLCGIDATCQIRSDCPAIKVIGLSMYSDKHYLLKDCAFEELARAIHLVVAGQIYLCPGIEDPAAPESG
jgi:DNA-binding NarL/FixJ family response regulator